MDLANLPLLTRTAQSHKHFYSVHFGCCAAVARHYYQGWAAHRTSHFPRRATWIQPSFYLWHVTLQFHDRCYKFYAYYYYSVMCCHNPQIQLNYDISRLPFYMARSVSPLHPAFPLKSSASLFLSSHSFFLLPLHPSSDLSNTLHGGSPLLLRDLSPS